MRQNVTMIPQHMQIERWRADVDDDKKWEKKNKHNNKVEQREKSDCEYDLENACIWQNYIYILTTVSVIMVNRQTHLAHDSE